MRKSNKSGYDSTARHGSNGQTPTDHRENGEWKWETSFVKRLGNLLESGFESDLTLVVGEMEFKVHRIFLQSGSKVLHNSIRRCNGEKLTLDNYDPDVFRFILNYLYTGKSNITVSTAVRVLNLSAQLEILALINQCAELLKLNTTKDNAIEILNEAMLCDQKDLIKTTLDFICFHGHEIVRMDSFNQLSLEGLVLLLQHDGLQVEGEIDVFNAVYRWGEARLAKKGLTSDTANMKAELATPLKHIRFPLMDHKEFRTIVASKKLLDAEDTNAVLTSFLLQIEDPGSIICEEFCTTTRAYRCVGKTDDESVDGRTPPRVPPGVNPPEGTRITVYRAGSSSAAVSRVGNKDIYEDSLVFLPPRDGKLTGIGISETCFDITQTKTDATRTIRDLTVAVDFIEMFETNGGKTLVAGSNIGTFERIQLTGFRLDHRFLFAHLPNPIPFRKNVWTRMLITFPGKEKYSYCVGFYKDKFVDTDDPSIVFKFRRATEEAASNIGIIHHFVVTLTR